MAKLSDLQLAALLEEIASTMKADMPIIESMKRLSTRRNGTIGKLSGTIAAALERGESLPDALRHSGAPLSGEAAATVQACQAGGDPSLLSSMAQLLRARLRHQQAARFAWLYPFALLVVAYLAGVFIMIPLVLQNVGLDYEWPQAVVAVSRWLNVMWMVPLIVFVVVLLPIVWIMNSKRSLPRDVRKYIFCRSLADQIHRGVPESDAIRHAGEMSGVPDFAGTADETLQSPAVASLLRRAPAQVIAMADGAPSQTIVAKLSFVATVFEQRARTRDYIWTHVVPRVGMILIGGGITLAYVCWFIAPVYRQVGQW